MKYQNIFLLIFAGLVLPLVCSANAAMGYFVNYTPGLVLLLFLGVSVVEAEIIRKALQCAQRRAFFIAVFVNLITSIIGLSIGWALYDKIGSNFLFHIFGVAFIFSFLIEFAFLPLFFKQTSKKRLFKVSFVMNLASYVFIIVFIFLDFLVIFSPIILFFVVYKIFRFLVPKKDFKRLIFIILSFILVAGFILFVSSQMPRGSSIARDSRIISAIAQARTVITGIYMDDGNYNDFDCLHEDMINLCAEIKNNYIESELDTPIIAKTIDGACIYSPLNKTEEKRLGLKKIYFWYCADSTGNAGRTTTNPAGVGYCVNEKSAVCPPAVKL